jgi:hypothetical protein
MNMFYRDCMNAKNIGLLNYRCFHSLLPMQRCAVNERLMGQSYINQKLPNEIETLKGELYIL